MLACKSVPPEMWKDQGGDISIQSAKETSYTNIKQNGPVLYITIALNYPINISISVKGMHEMFSSSHCPIFFI